MTTSLNDGIAHRIKGTGAEIHLVAVVVPITVSIGVCGISPDGGFVGIRQPVGIAIKARRLSGGSLRTGDGVLHAPGGAGGADRIGAGRYLLSVREPIAVGVPDQGIGARRKEFLAVGETITIRVPNQGIRTI